MYANLYLISRFLCSPLEAMYTLLIFIAAKELNVTPLQLAVLAGSKPISSLLAFYCSTSVTGKPQTFKKYLICINTLAALPALTFLFIENNWFFVASFAIFMVGLRAVFPVWTTLLKGSMSLEAMSGLQAKAISVQQVFTIFCPLLFGYLIDGDKEIWKYLFLGLGILQIFNSMVMLMLPLPNFLPQNLIESSSSSLLSPMTQWRESWNILKKRSDFTHYLILFFCGGAGLVMMQSSLPLFFKNNLHLSYTTITLAISCCKGIALIASVKLWSNWVNKTSLFRFNFYINIVSCLFIGFILLSNYQTNFLFIAYLLYGAMQAGCELSWNMNGPIFAKDKESTLFSSLNLPLIGIRGLICHSLGQWILFHTSVNVVFIVAGILTVVSVGYAHLLAVRQNRVCELI